MHTTSTLNMERDTPYQKNFKSIASTSKLFDKCSKIVFSNLKKKFNKKVHTTKHLTSTNCDKQNFY